MAFTMTVAELIAADTSGLLSKHASWERIPLANVAVVVNGAPFESSLFSSTDGIPLIRIRDVVTGVTSTYYTGNYEDVFVVEQGDLLVGMDGDFNSAYWGSQRALLNQRVCKITPNTEFYDKHFLGYVLPGYLAAINANTPSVTVKHLSSKTIGEIDLPLPPRAEQIRIVEKLEELLSDLDAGVAELKAAQKKLGQYRQSLLKAAVEGALTAEWRAARAPLPPGGGGVGGEGASTPTTEDQAWLHARARELRQQQTPHEQALWQQLRAKRFSGYKFRRQQVLGRFIVDFVCFDRRLIVELDGGQHADAGGYDHQRDTWLKQQGFRVLRFWNNEWATQPEAVLEAIWQALEHEPPLPNPSPARGEGLIPETGAQLLARILTERRARWEAKQLAKFKEQGKAPPKDWQQKYPEPVQPDSTDLPALPEGWVWASLDMLGEIASGVAKGTKRDADVQVREVPYLRVANVQRGFLDLSEVKSIWATERDIAELTLQAGDVLFNEGGDRDKLGRGWVWRDEVANCIHQNHVFRMRPYLPEVLPELISHHGNTFGKIWFQNAGKQTTNLASINMTMLRMFPVPLGPAEEQRELLNRLDVQIEHLNRQELAVEMALKQSTAQRQNILRAAFAGQLVPQDPNDEPASVLLERIRAERVTRAAAKPPRARKVKEAA